ncbi:MAG TPA: hypothetical protein VGG31_00615 [Candidatus Dormibacteraeota bacterium]
MDATTLLLVTVAIFSVYVVGVGGSTATAIASREAWRRRFREAASPNLDDSPAVLEAPALPRPVRLLRVAGWVAFLPALLLGGFATRSYAWVEPVIVVVMVALNAFFFTAMQGLGQRLTLTAEGFELGGRSVRWIHVTELTGAHVGPFRGMRMSEPGEWQDPKLVPNVIFYRLNRALIRPDKSLLQRFTGLTYYDGMIRNAFGVTTERLLQAMRERQRRALDAEGPPLGRRVRNP